MDGLKRLVRLENEAADFGFKWDEPGQIIEQILSEVKEVQAHLKDKDKQKLQEEMGDLLHAVFSLCVFCQLDPHDTLEKSVDKFERRFEAVKVLAAQQGLTSLNSKSFDELMQFWKKAKDITHQ